MNVNHSAAMKQDYGFSQQLYLCKLRIIQNDIAIRICTIARTY